MSITLQEIIAIIKTEAEVSGFKTVSELQVNEKDTSDTELPKMYIKLVETAYVKLQISAVEEIYELRLLMVVAQDETPITTLKTIQDLFFKNLLENETVNFRDLINGEKITFEKSTLTNDIKLLNKVGGNSLVMTMKIENINNLV